MLAFDSASVTDLLKEFSQTSASRIAIGYVLMVNIFKLLLVGLIFFFCFLLNLLSSGLVQSSS